MTTIDFCETTIPAADGASLFLRSAEPTGAAKATVVLTHGMGEHSGRYAHVAELLVGSGYRFCTFDLRGHGRSGGRRGYIERYGEFLDDLDLVVKHSTSGEGPLFLYGHSMGGQVTLNYLRLRQPKVRGAVITSPWLELAFKPAPWKVLLAKIMLGVWPAFTQDGPDDDALLSHDPAFLQSMQGRELSHHKMSARMYAELVRGADEARDGWAACNCPVLLIHGAEDPLTSVTATRTFYEKAASLDKTLRIYPSMLHETHNEVGREEVLRDIVGWLDARCADNQ